MTIFKAYDIRGLVPERARRPRTPGASGAPSRASSEAAAVAVGRDARTHSPGAPRRPRDGAPPRRAPTSSTSASSRRRCSTSPSTALDARGRRDGDGLPQSAPQYNGFKICGAARGPGRRGERACARSSAWRRSRRPPAARPGGAPAARRDATPTSSTCSRWRAARPALRVAIDCGNGMAGVGLEPLLARLPLRVERLYFEPDGRFPNHPADPLARREPRRRAARRCGAAAPTSASPSTATATARSSSTSAASRCPPTS